MQRAAGKVSKCASAQRDAKEPERLLRYQSVYPFLFGVQCEVWIGPWLSCYVRECLH
jgi:hypothetical protein